MIGLVAMLSLSPAGITLGSRGQEGRGLFVRYDVWSWLAEACVGLIAVGLTALVVGYLIRMRGWEVGFGFTFLTLLITGYAPAVALTPLYGATALVSLALTTIALRMRMRPSGREPRTALGQVPQAYRRGVAIAVAIGVPAMVVYAAGYSVTHPLTLRGVDSKPYAREGRDAARYIFNLTNDGPADVENIEIVRIEGSPALQLEGVGVPANEWSWDGSGAPTPPLSPLAGRELGSHGSGVELEMEFRQGSLCRSGVASADAVWVRYRVLGADHEQRLPLDPVPTLRCN